MHNVLEKLTFFSIKEVFLKTLILYFFLYARLAFIETLTLYSRYDVYVLYARSAFFETLKGYPVLEH